MTRIAASILKKPVAIALFVSAAALPARTSTSVTQSQLEFRSSDTKLVQSFLWAKQQALQYVFDGDPVGPWYEAALPHREAFCMRDVSHQAMGAQGLGLAAYTLNMQQRFAENISDSRDWCSYWEINKDNKPAPVDYRDDNDFWYDLPANFDVMDSCYRMYLWTGDDAYLKNPAIINFYRRTVSDYVKRWDLGPDSVMHRPQKIMNIRSGNQSISRLQRSRGIPGYSEGREPFTTGIDLLATEYAAYKDYASLLLLMGKPEESREWAAKAVAMKSLVNGRWWDAQAGHFYSFLGLDHELNGESDIDPLYYNVADGGVKSQAALNHLVAGIEAKPAQQIEVESHYPEVLYRYGRPDIAYLEIMDLTRPDRPRKEYPENSYAVIGAMLTGLMGVNVELQGAPVTKRFVVSTLSGLTPVTADAEMDHIPVHGNIIRVKHTGGDVTQLTNESGPALQWKCEFHGHREVSVQGKQAKAGLAEIKGEQRISWVIVTVPTGSTITVRAISKSHG